MAQPQSDFSQRIITWQKQHGRHDLPWQNTQDPYAIWVSEIMLQQTQVSAVKAYYQRFMQRFANLSQLAQASQDDVLRHWSGLGYYSRARNLHQAAQQIMDEYQGIFPQQLSLIQSLPGIGRSTAAAICAFAFGQNQAILDGNVKRIFARHFLISGWPGLPLVQKQMWQIAEELVPQQDIQAYTQGLMDLGATLCKRSQPRCADCPIQRSCQAYAQNQVAQLPSRKPAKKLALKQTVMLMILDGDHVLLEKRGPSGIWGGLWSLPEIAPDQIAQEQVLSRFALQAEADEPWQQLTHHFTHFTLEITAQPLRLTQAAHACHAPNWLWLPIDEAIQAAIPTPVRKLLLSLQQTV